ncbi:hypothetical protein [Kamptonema formosum]|uniref:hypothetical protein n=1 Tax=Kamptonema formosum TaxID=331992 RepID=UPI00035CE069|nr:hypothetical protein [Oscillatoria sp. PCC 10802]
MPALKQKTPVPALKQEAPVRSLQQTLLLPALKQMALNRRIPLPVATLTPYRALNRKTLLLPAQQTIPFPPQKPMTPLPAHKHPTPY